MNAAAWPPGGVLHGLGTLWRGSGLLNPEDECSPALPQPPPLLTGSPAGRCLGVAPPQPGARPPVL